MTAIKQLTVPFLKIYSIYKLLQRILLKLRRISSFYKTAVVEPEGGYFMKGKVVNLQPFKYINSHPVELKGKRLGFFEGGFVFYPINVKESSSTEVQNIDLYTIEIEGGESFCVENLLVRAHQPS